MLVLLHPVYYSITCVLLDTLCIIYEPLKCPTGSYLHYKVF